MLGGESCQGVGSEVGKTLDRRIRLGQTGSELVHFRLESFDLSSLQIGSLPGVPLLLKPMLEFGAQVRVGRVP